MSNKCSPQVPTGLRALLRLLIACTACAAQAREVWQLDAPDALRPLLVQHLPAQTQDDSATVPDRAARIALARRLRNSAQDLLATEGYFTPSIDIDTSVDVLVMRIAPGPQSHVASVNIQFIGAISEDPAHAERIERLRNAWPLGVGKPFRQQEWASAKDDTLYALNGELFASARLVASQADVDPDQAAVHLSLTLDSGPPLYLGALRIDGLQQHKGALIQRYNPLSEGEPYRRERLLELQAALQNTPYFSAVEVELLPNEAQAGQAPVRVRVSEAKPKRASIGIGYSSNTGYRIDFGFRHNDFLRQAWQLNTGVRFEEKRQAAFADIYLPQRNNGARDSFGVLTDQSDIEGLQIQKNSIGIMRSTTRGNIEQSLGLSWQREDREAEGNPTITKSALALNWVWTQRKVDNLLDPRNGYTLQIQLGGGAQLLLSDANFIRGYSRLHLWHSLNARNVLSLRVEGGYTAAKSRTHVPEDFLFRTGGAQSVRGYDYLSLGVREARATVGGRYMATTSLEHTYWFNERWGLATFFDTGNATDDLEAFRLHHGYGLGARWKSPAGNLAFDLAYGQANRRIRPHIAIAVAF